MADPGPGNPRRILVVEADRALRSLVNDAIAASGLPLETVSATCAEEALAIVGAHDPEIVVMSETLPDATGTDLLRRISDLRREIPVFVLGDRESEEAIVDFLRHGAADYLPLRGPLLARLPYLCFRAAQARRVLRVLEQALEDRKDDLRAGNDPAGDAVARAGTDRLLSAVSHDLRSPLAGLVALIDLLAGGTDGPLTTAQAARIKRIRAAADRLVSVAGQVADLALVASDRLPLFSGLVDIGNVAMLAVQDLEAAARSRAVDLALRLPGELPPVRGDASRIRQVLVILLSDALKRVERAVLEVAARRQGPMVELTLRGIPRGIPIEALPAPAHGEPGAAGVHADASEGLGLSVASAIVRLHGGRLGSGLTDSGGHVITLTLPAAQPEERLRSEAGSETQPRP